MADKSKLRTYIAESRKERYADGGDVDPTEGIVARQQAQQEQVLPSERQPYSAPLQPQEAGLEHPAISPEEVLGGAVAGPLAEGAIGAGEAVANQGARFLADEAGSVPLSGSGTGLLSQAQSKLGYVETPQGVTMPVEQARSFLNDAQAGLEAGVLRPEHVQAAQQHFNRAQMFADRLKQGRKAYADGGDVEPAPVDRAPAATEQETQSPVPEISANTHVNVLNPAGDLVSIPQESLNDAIATGYKQASPQDVDSYVKEQKYGTAGQQVKAGLEGLASGIAGPFAPAIETGLGVKPEDIRGREEVNPGIHAVTQGAGLVGGSVLGTGEGAVLGEAGNALRAALPAGGSGFVKQVGPEAVKAAFEAALFQGGEEAAKKFKDDPELSASHAMMDIGLAAVMGGVFGGPIGAALHGASMELPKIAEPAFVSEVDRPALEAGDFAASIKHSDNLSPSTRSKIIGNLMDTSEKAEAPAIKAAAKRLGAPVLEGMVSDNEWVQKGEDALINGAPTYSGIKRAKLYNDAYGTAANAVDEALGEGSVHTKAELGSLFKDSLTKQISEENAPIKDMYDRIKATGGVVPVSEKSVQSLKSELEQIPEFRVTGDSPQGRLIGSTLRNLDNVKTVDDLKFVKDSVWDSVNATIPGERRAAAILSDKLGNLQEAEVMSAAKKANSPELFADFVRQKEEAAAAYKPFMTKVKTLSEQMGKGKVHGPKDALNFIQNLTPEEITQKLFSKKDSGFNRFFAKEFPEEHAMMQQYQKGILRENASKSGELSQKVLFNQINKLEPEIQKSIFTPSELTKLKDAETYIRSFPKNFNPSGTSGMSAFREMFTHPMAAAAANARDFAIEKFVKNMPSHEVDNAIKLAQAAVKGDRLMNKATKSLLDKSASVPIGIIPSLASRTKLDKLVSNFAANPSEMMKLGDNNPVPQYAGSFSATSSRAVQYLSSIRPNTDQQNPLDTKRKPTPAEQSAYDRALDIAQNPLVVLDRMHKGILTVKDLEALKAVHPDAYRGLQQRLMTGIMDQSSKGKVIPYSTRLQLSMFLGQPLDSTMTPMAILSAQPKAQEAPQNAPQPKTKGNPAKLTGISKSAMTSAQDREAARAGHQKD